MRKNNFFIKVQNTIVFNSIFAQLVRDNPGKKAKEYLEEYDKCPENFNNCFELSYDEISPGAKEERRNIIERCLAMEGLIIE